MGARRRIPSGRLLTALALFAAGCIQDADTVLEPDPVDGGADARQPDAEAPPPVAPAARLEVEPPTLVFSARGEVLSLTLHNTGDGPLHLAGLQLDGLGFEVTRDGRNARLMPPDELTGPDGLAPGGSLRLDVEALGEPPVEAMLTLRSNDPDQPEVQVPMGFADGDCARLEPASHAFGVVELGEAAQVVLDLVNCGAAPLAVDRIALSEGDPGFTLVPPGAREPLDPGARRRVEVAFAPVVAGPVRNALIVDAGAVRLEAPLTGRGLAPRCPVAMVADDAPVVTPRRGITLDASPSADPDGPAGRPALYEWVVIDRPEGSVSGPLEAFFDPERPFDGGPEDDPTTPIAVFSPDRAGDYLFELRVTGARGCVDVLPVRVEACACGQDGFTVEVDWQTPGDPDPTDAYGVDLDLHLLHPLAGNWFDPGYDCHYASPTPDWGQLENRVDDPVLDRDAIGAGPERIVLGVPETTDALGAPYRFAVHHRGLRADPAAPDAIPPARGTPATVRVWFGEALVGEFERVLGDGQFWEVGRIHVPAYRLDVADLVFDERP